MRELILKETFKQEDTSESVTHHDCISRYVRACTHVSESLKFLHGSAHLFFYLLSESVFCFLPAVCYLCLCPSWEHTHAQKLFSSGSAGICKQLLESQMLSLLSKQTSFLSFCASKENFSLLTAASATPQTSTLREAMRWFVPLMISSS